MNSRSNYAQAGFSICGTTPLIQNKFSTKAIEQMLAKHMALPTKRTPKVPRQVLADARILNLAGQVCIPAVGVKTAMVTASSQLKSFDRHKKDLLIALFVEGQGLPIEFVASESPEARALGLGGIEPRMDMVRTSGIARTPDVRFRPQYNDWSTKFVVTYNSDLVSTESVVQLVDLAGRVGVGEWRPEKRGIHGQFAINRSLEPNELEGVIAACSIPLETPRIPTWALDAGIDEATLVRMFDGTKAGVADAMGRLKKEDADVDE